MPDPTSNDDEFADLFQKLPDPRGRVTPPAVAGAPATEPAASEAPGSRRAAREAAAAGQQAEPTTPPLAQTTAPPTEPAPVTAPAPTSSAAGLEDLFTGRTTTQDLGHVPPPPSRRKRRAGGWIALGIVVVLLGGLAAGGLWVWNSYEPQIRELMGWEEPLDYEDGMATGEAVIEVVDGDTGQSISPKLYEAGVTMTPEAFYSYLVDTGQNPPFVPGVFQLQKKMTSEAALAAILDPENKLENSAVIPEGRTVDNTLELLSEGMGMPLKDLKAAVKHPADYGVEADSLEGWLFPAMYTVNPDTTAPELIQKMVDRTIEALDKADVPEADRQEILTIASIIQREARFEDDFYKVSRVIQNRLSPDNQETYGKLQMDSTAQYGYGEMHDGTVSSSAEALADDNPWNTYIHPGLPAGPIANSGELAIDAAMHPADGDWLYFVTVNLDTGETVFTSNLADHEAAVAQWQSWCADHPDSGC
ncbi:endolytic transglycosylase MltG [Microbacterium terricola]|uniref:Endolytic murein transglycosylase n=1 Tax=Microbacterium terricola TaxID=344163 RepID=A0ABM8DY44_9MICO|nr:endolytic transglycosylase MltG [Microbacterium terricola]UYK38713.1 endolytic transglycosylase MltG [Microbacterium terricola]BDV30598.1 hypothetical protein Microterr_12580 [Microbacterium terricola]